MRIRLFVLALILAFGPVIAQGAVTPDEACNFGNKCSTVCGKVAEISYMPDLTNQPTFIYLEKPFPNQVFEIVIWGRVRTSFSKTPEILFSGKKVCVSGTVTQFMGIPEVIVDNPSQVSVISERK